MISPILVKNIPFIRIICSTPTITLTFIPSDAYAHGGSKSNCATDVYGNPDGCKHNVYEKKRNKAKCHLHDYDMANGRWKNKFTGVLGISGGDCKKT